METKRDSFDPVETEVEAEAEFESQRMQSTPFNRIAEIERSNKEYRELTTEKPVERPVVLPGAKPGTTRFPA